MTAKDQLIQDYLFQIRLLTQENQQKTGEIKDLSHSLSLLEESQAISQNRLSELEFRLGLEDKRRYEESSLNLLKIKKLEENNNRLSESVSQLQEQLMGAGKAITELLHHNSEKDQSIIKYESLLARMESGLSEKNTEKEELLSLLESQKGELADLNPRLELISDLETELRSSQNSIKELKSANSEILRENKELFVALKAEKQLNEQRERTIGELERRIEKYEGLFCQYNLELLAQKESLTERKEAEKTVENGFYGEIMGLKDNMADLKEILAIKEQEINRLTHCLHLKTADFDSLALEIEELLSTLKTGNLSVLSGLESKSAVLTELRIFVLGLAKDKQKYEKFHRKIKDKVRVYRENTRRFSLYETGKPPRSLPTFNQDLRLRTEASESPGVKTLGDRLRTLEGILGISSDD